LNVVAPVVQNAAARLGSLLFLAAAGSTGFVKPGLGQAFLHHLAGTMSTTHGPKKASLEYYWGEHTIWILLGRCEHKYRPLNEAQYIFVDEMMKFGGIDPAIDGKSQSIGCRLVSVVTYLARASS
jgi:hypothetical protein